LTSAEGKEQILHIYGPGHPIGEVPVFSGSRFPANAMAIEKSRMLFFPRRDFVDLISAHPSLALNMLAVLSLRLRQFTVQIENLSLKEVPARLASYLIFLSEKQVGVMISRRRKKLQELIEVDDDDPGIPAADHQRIFEPWKLPFKCLELLA
jgi:CRP-like cAMP-binding protein